jgi:type I restriction enzyme S subunit
MIFSESILDCEMKPLSELLDLIVDNRGKSVPTTDLGIPLIATNCIKNSELFPTYEKVRYVSKEIYDSWFRAHPKPGDIIFVNKGKPGSVVMVPDPVDFCIAQDMMAFRVNKNIIYNKFLFAVLRSPVFQTQIMNYHVGTMIPHFKKGDLDKLLIPVPDMEIQEYIGNLYYTFSYKIEVNNQINKTLENMAQAIFKQWFVDFEFPNEDGEPYKSSGGEMVESELGLIPKGWEVGKFIDLIEITSGKRPGKRSDLAMEDCKYPLVGASSIMSYTDDFNFEEKILVIGRVGTHGVVQRFNNKVWASDNTLVIKSDNYEFAYQVLNQIDYKAINRGSTQPLITQRDIKNYSLIIPTEGYLNMFELLVGSLFETHSNHCIENSKLTEIRDSLLPKLMSGEIRVPIDEEGDAS